MATLTLAQAEVLRDLAYPDMGICVQLGHPSMHGATIASFLDARRHTKPVPPHIVRFLLDHAYIEPIDRPDGSRPGEWYVISDAGRKALEPV